MNISCEISTCQFDSFDKLIATIKLIKDVPTETPVFFECKCPNTSEITKFLVIPEHFIMGYLHCTLLAMDNPKELNNHPSIEKNKIKIKVDSILSWEVLNGKPFLNFGTGFVTQKYLKMIMPI